MKILWAYLSGVGRSVSAYWFKRRYDAEATAFCADIKQLKGLANVRRQVLETRATNVQVGRLTDRFLAGHTFSSLGIVGCARGNSSYSSTSRPRAR
jgi:argininosuccinate synthase